VNWSADAAPFGVIIGGVEYRPNNLHLHKCELGVPCQNSIRVEYIDIMGISGQAS